MNDNDVRNAAGDGRTGQGSLLIVAKVKDGSARALELLLDYVGHPPKPEDLETNKVIPFKSLKSVHFARLLILPASPGPPKRGGGFEPATPIPTQFLFATDFDGTLADHLRELIDVATDGLDQLFEHCEEWPGLGQRDREGKYLALVDFIGRHSVPANTFYTGTMSRTVSQIEREAALRDAIEKFLDAHAAEFPNDPVCIHNRVREWVFHDPRFAWLHQRPGPFPKAMAKPGPPEYPQIPLTILLGVVLLVVGLAVRLLASWRLAGIVDGAIVAVVAAACLLVRVLSATDDVIIQPDTAARAKVLVTDEDRIGQNQLTTINYIKRPLWFRRLVLQFILAFTNIVARSIENQGSLSGITSIHFARWVIIDGGRRLLFFSNFDSSWESYLSEFVDKAHAGLTGIWSNVVGFPRARGLFGGGAADEQRFKALARDSQVRTHVWYSAYKTLTVRNVNDNSRLRLGLYKDLTEAEALVWLRMAVPREDVEPAPRDIPKPSIEEHDIQGLVVRSYKELQHAAYVLVDFGDSDARAWLHDLIPRITRMSQRSDEIIKARRALNVAFTRRGLARLGLADDAVGFSREFTEGMAGTEHRQRLLGDVGDSAPSRWQWGNKESRCIDAMLFVYALDASELESCLNRERACAERAGLTAHTVLPTIWLPENKEHFGFHDGIAQPRIAGFSRDGTKAARDLDVPAGEVVLGYENAYAQFPMSPTVDETPTSARYLAKSAPDDAGLALPRDFGRNGTYVVIRQLHQKVKEFWTDVDERARHDAEQRKLLAAKMIGRWPNGAPLVQFDKSEPKGWDPENEKDKGNGFMYRQDLNGDSCPFGAHIRRTHPRDSLLPNTRESLRVAARRRLLRRGRTYGEPLWSVPFDPEDILKQVGLGERGLHFICLNTDIARQFEFVQSAWMNNPKFDGLYSDPDAVISPRHSSAGSRPPATAFTVQRNPVRERHHDLKQFTTMVGGAYLFMPGINAMHYLADEERATGSRSSRD